ncbi:MAG TPA: hypothetical protein PKA06_12445, partial [Gemmatales bacterium]|nr:hypothetical protein [Gemmatales bacterium]
MSDTQITILTAEALQEALPAITWFVQSISPLALSRHPHWLRVFQKAMQHEPYAILATRQGSLMGVLPLVHM